MSELLTCCKPATTTQTFTKFLDLGLPVAAPSMRMELSTEVLQGHTT